MTIFIFIMCSGCPILFPDTLLHGSAPASATGHLPQAPSFGNLQMDSWHRSSCSLPTSGATRQSHPSQRMAVLKVALKIPSSANSFFADTLISVIDSYHTPFT